MIDSCGVIPSNIRFWHRLIRVQPPVHNVTMPSPHCILVTSTYTAFRTWILSCFCRPDYKKLRYLLFESAVLN